MLVLFEYQPKMAAMVYSIGRKFPFRNGHKMLRRTWMVVELRFLLRFRWSLLCLQDSSPRGLCRNSITLNYSQYITLLSEDGVCSL